jgi:GNAT superfamily N-acetyltransferase
VIIRPAALADIDVILSMRRERAAWLAGLGQSQWQVPWPRTAVTAAVSAGQTWMVWDGDDPVASVTLTAWVDTEGLWKLAHDEGALWRPSDDPADALYVSKLMVPRAYAGAGLGAEILDWAGGRAYDGGLLWLRLDAWTTNEDLHAYYRRLGFAHVRTVTSRSSGWCAQRPAQPYMGHRLKMDG